MTICASLRGGFSMRIPLADITLPTTAQIYGVLTIVATSLGIASALGVLGWLTVPKAVLYARLRYAERRQAVAESGLASISAGFEALDRRVEQLLAEVRRQGDETAALRAGTEQLRTNLAEATTYIVSVVRHFRQRSGTIATMPEPPPSIRAAVDAGIHSHEGELVKEQP